MGGILQRAAYFWVDEERRRLRDNRLLGEGDSRVREAEHG